MERSPDAATSGAGGGGHGFSWRAAGAILVALSFLLGVGMIVASSTIAAPTDEPLRPPQPDPAVAPPPLRASPSTTEPAGTPSPKAIDAPTPTAGDRPAPEASAGPSRAEGRSPEGGRPSPTAKDDEPSFRPPTAMTRSAPTRIRIPRIDVDAKIMRLGVDKQGRMAVPPLKKADLTGWYKLGPSPGEIGNSVLVGHVDSYAMGPAVFFKLGALKPGDTITINRKDGTKAKFTVDGVAAYPKDKFPTSQVYGSSGKAELRLVTCGGAFDRAAREYKDNVIVFATLKT